MVPGFAGCSLGSWNVHDKKNYGRTHTSSHVNYIIYLCNMYQLYQLNIYIHQHRSTNTIRTHELTGHHSVSHNQSWVNWSCTFSNPRRVVVDSLGILAHLTSDDGGVFHHLRNTRYLCSMKPFSVLLSQDPWGLWIGKYRICISHIRINISYYLHNLHIYIFDWQILLTFSLDMHAEYMKIHAYSWRDVFSSISHLQRQLPGLLCAAQRFQRSRDGAKREGRGWASPPKKESRTKLEMFQTFGV